MKNPFKTVYYFIYWRLNLMDLYRFTKHKLQRLFRVYSTQDLWGVGDRLAEITYKHLLAFKKMKRHGIPGSISLISCTCKKEDLEHGQCVNDKCFQRACLNWEYTLDKMIDAFRIIAESDYDIEDDVPHSMPDGERKEVKGGIQYVLEEWKEKENDVWFKKYKENTNIQNKKVEDGLKLYIKYIHSLWD